MAIHTSSPTMYLINSTYTRQSRRLLRFIHKPIAAKASFIHTHHILQPCREHQQKLLLDGGAMDRWLAWQRGSWCLYVVCGSPNKHYLRRRLIPLYISILIKWGRHTTTSLWVYWWTTTASGWVDGWLHNRESYI